MWVVFKASNCWIFTSQYMTSLIPWRLPFSVRICSSLVIKLHATSADAGIQYSPLTHDSVFPLIHYFWPE